MDSSLPDRDFSFTTTRLELRHLLPHHAKFVGEMYSSPVFQEDEEVPRVFTEELARKLLEGRFGDVQRKFGYGQFLVSLRETNTPIGMVSLMRDTHALPDIGYAILAEYNGQGYATEAAKGLIAYAKAHWGLPGVFAFMNPANARSQHVAKKIGLEFRGVRYVKAFGGQTAVWAEPGMDQDLTVYGVDNDEPVSVEKPVV